MVSAVRIALRDNSKYHRKGSITADEPWKDSINEAGSHTRVKHMTQRPENGFVPRTEAAPSILTLIKGAACLPRLFIVPPEPVVPKSLSLAGDLITY